MCDPPLDEGAWLLLRRAFIEPLDVRHIVGYKGFASSQLVAQQFSLPNGLLGPRTGYAGSVPNSPGSLRSGRPTDGTQLARAQPVSLGVVSIRLAVTSRPILVTTRSMKRSMLLTMRRTCGRCGMARDRTAERRKGPPGPFAMVACRIAYANI